MKKTNKLYKKAINLYNNGYIDKSISVCEKSIALDIRNSAALNLKGLLLYIKGDINEARRVWEINYKANNDMVSKKYLNDSRNDIDNKKLYEESIDLINKIKIDEAIKKLEFCKNSDFNAININNALTTCYIKKGEFEKANVCIDEVLKIDKNNKIAKGNKKLLISLGVIDKKRDFKKAVIYSFSFFVVILLIFTIKFGISKIKSYKNDNIISTCNNNSYVAEKKNDKCTNRKTYKVINSEENNGADKTIYNKTEKGKDKELSTEKSSVTNEGENRKVNKEIHVASKYTTIQGEKSYDKGPEKLSIDKVSECIEKKDIESLYKYVDEWDSKQLNINERAIISKAKKLLNEYACGFYYNKGLDAYKSKEYKAAVQNFLKGIIYGKANYLYEHDLYMLAVSYEKMNDIENSLMYYEMYNKEFNEKKYIKNGTYIEIVLYRLAMLYKDIDINKSKKYAKILNTEYAKSKYNNSNIYEIIKMNSSN
ncbi:tetratricopeptide repeat protein [Clostridium tepidiprofundi DSM 19306]|uniref:Tetratricopeptide repeat protein n=1 Tax=Clostridium tepidiprofundi DSM 19306 TaxID=1121338 RepID=A0A151B5P4_9CLOT|nr:hypothetical protein [Clostridium tepidiprofundi]KYH35235.1 tetratricopeptide repeat protein [Clostridium tepidiprofundi DSM 19306]